MRTETIEIFTYDELSEAAQENARDWYLGAGLQYDWHDEWRDSLAGFVALIPYACRPDYEVSTFAHSYCRLRSDMPDDVSGLQGARAWKWFLNNGFFDAKLLSGGCPLTGYCGDESLLDPLRKFRDDPDTSLTVGDVLQKCLNHWVSDWVADMESQTDPEYVAEHLIANEYEFTADGSRH